MADGIDPNGLGQFHVPFKCSITRHVVAEIEEDARKDQSDRTVVVGSFINGMAALEERLIRLEDRLASLEPGQSSLT
jgi:hypothetical protein